MKSLAVVVESIFIWEGGRLHRQQCRGTRVLPLPKSYGHGVNITRHYNKLQCTKENDYEVARMASVKAVLTGGED